LQPAIEERLKRSTQFECCDFAQMHCKIWGNSSIKEQMSDSARFTLKGVSPMQRKIERPDRDVPAGFEALKPYLAHDELWSPSDALALLLDNPAVRRRVGEIIARTKEKDENERKR
jgi:hypothetical protein